MLGQAIQLGRQALWLALWASLPALAAGAVAGLAVGALTQRLGAHDPAVQHLPRAMAVGAAVALGGAWMARALITFAHSLWSSMPLWAA